jgi:FCD domain
MVDLSGARFGPISRTTLPQEIVKEFVARLERGALRAGDPPPAIARNPELEGREAARVATPHHRAIYEAIRRGDARAARRATARHIETEGHRLVAAPRQAEAPPEREAPAR